MTGRKDTGEAGIRDVFMAAAVLVTFLSIIALLYAPTRTYAENVSSFRYIDCHDHLMGQIVSRSGMDFDYTGAIETALMRMDSFGIKKAVIVPHPFTFGQPYRYDLADFVDLLKKRTDRFAFMGGGGTLNVMIHQAAMEGVVTPGMKKEFEEEAAKIISSGAVGFGEMSAEHLSLTDRHPYQSAPADHPLMLRLADIAAQHGMVIDIHMEAVLKEMPPPARIRSSANPKTLKPNIAAFEKLLAHNRNARIIWAHAGWDNTGDRTVALMAGLLEKHPNLYMSIKIGRDSLPANRPVDENGLKPQWLELLQKFPDRFIIGSDEFFASPRNNIPSPPRLEAASRFLKLLPPDLARKIGLENPARLFPASTR